MSEPTYKQPMERYFRREIKRLTAENERLRAALGEIVNGPTLDQIAVQIAKGALAPPRPPEEGI